MALAVAGVALVAYLLFGGEKKEQPKPLAPKSEVPAVKDRASSATDLRSDSKDSKYPSSGIMNITQTVTPVNGVTQAAEQAAANPMPAAVPVTPAIASGAPAIEPVGAVGPVVAPVSRGAFG